LRSLFFISVLDTIFARGRQRSLELTKHFVGLVISSRYLSGEKRASFRFLYREMTSGFLLFLSLVFSIRTRKKRSTRTERALSFRVKKMRLFSFFLYREMTRASITILILLICSHSFAAKLKPGTYRAVLVLDTINEIELPFNFDVIKKGKKLQIIIKNASEKIVVDEITIKGDSVNFKMPVFDTEFRTKLVNGNLQGVWINHYRKEKNIIPFKAEFDNPNRFSFAPGKMNPYFEGRWETTFSPGKPDSSKAIGIFNHLEQTDYIHGTFLTETGDYRFLEGMKVTNKLYLSCFDGSHAFLFIAIHKDNKFTGTFYSGAHWKEEWIAVKNEEFKLRDAEEITTIKDPNTQPNFTFPNLDGNKVSLSDKKFENKPVIIQIMGSWCPNCMDESNYLGGIFKQYQKQGLEIIALAFEKTDDLTIATKNVNRLKKKFDLQYEILLTQLTGKDKAGETFPALSKITAFPTTIFLNKEHKIVKIHTGFSGPATGNDYLVYKIRTENLINQLIKQ
jgi:thiol-disulfide isomerase/thioredoxin